MVERLWICVTILGIILSIVLLICIHFDSPELELERAVQGHEIWFEHNEDYSLWTWYLRGEPIWEGTLTELAELLARDGDR